MTIQKLIEKINEISPKAAAYVRDEAPSLESYKTSGFGNKLVNIFVWDDTPQGADYWCKISSRLGNQLG